MPNRRDFLRTTGLAGLATVVAPTARGLDAQTPIARAHGPLQQVAQDEAYWKRVADQYRIVDRPTNMEAGFFGMMAAPVLAAFHQHIDRVNRASSHFARREYPALEQVARERVAKYVGALPTEIALTRGATEALQSLIGQYRNVGAGDSVLYADLDYNAMQWAMNALAERVGARVVQIEIPEPASRDAILATYTAALDANPRTRLVLLTHCNNKTGLLHPVREIAALAKARGADVIVDAAHSFGQVPLTMDALGADFVGLNLHKWIGAPVGIGALYIRTGRLDAIARAHGDEGALTSVTSRVHSGTSHFATTMTIPNALDFQEAIGIEQKAARLRYLRDRWVNVVRKVPGVDVLTPDDAGMVCALTSFRLHGRGSREANLAVAQTLLDEFGLFTVQRAGIARGDCVRVTPMLYNSAADADRLAAAITAIASRG